MLERFIQWGRHFLEKRTTQRNYRSGLVDLEDVSNNRADPRELPRPIQNESSSCLLYFQSVCQDSKPFETEENEIGRCTVLQQFGKPETPECLCINCSELADTFADCIICMEPLQGAKIFSCTYCGNITCWTCSERVPHCPFCRADESRNFRSRNITLERLLTKLVLPCRNARWGCGEFMHYSTREVHELACQYTPMGCPWHQICGWQGDPKELTHHLKKEHMLAILPGSGITIEISQFRAKMVLSDRKPRKYTVSLACYASIFVCKPSLYMRKKDAIDKKTCCLFLCEHPQCWTARHSWFYGHIQLIPGTLRTRSKAQWITEKEKSELKHPFTLVKTRHSTTKVCNVATSVNLNDLPRIHCRDLLKLCYTPFHHKRMQHQHYSYNSGGNIFPKIITLPQPIIRHKSDNKMCNCSQKGKDGKANQELRNSYETKRQLGFDEKDKVGQTLSKSSSSTQITKLQVKELQELEQVKSDNKMCNSSQKGKDEKANQELRNSYETKRQLDFDEKDKAGQTLSKSSSSTQITKLQVKELQELEQVKSNDITICDCYQKGKKGKSNQDSRNAYKTKNQSNVDEKDTQGEEVSSTSGTTAQIKNGKKLGQVKSNDFTKCDCHKTKNEKENQETRYSSETKNKQGELLLFDATPQITKSKAKKQQELEQAASSPLFKERDSSIYNVTSGPELLAVAGPSSSSCHTPFLLISQEDRPYDMEEDDEKVLEITDPVLIDNNDADSSPLFTLFPHLVTTYPYTTNLQELGSTSDVTQHLASFGIDADFSKLKPASRLIPPHKVWLSTLVEVPREAEIEEEIESNTSDEDEDIVQSVIDYESDDEEISDG